MRTVIVPVDFSETALNAAGFAAQMLQGHYGETMLLYHMYEHSNHADSVREALADLQTNLQDNQYVKTETLAEQGDDLISALVRVARHRDADLVVMGITGKTPGEQFLLSSHALRFIREKLCPVLTIPPEARYHGIRNVALATDLKNVGTSVPVTPITSVLEVFSPAMHIINVNDEQYVSPTEEEAAARNKLAGLFDRFHPEFHFIGISNFLEALNQFVADRNIDLLINVPRRHSRLEEMFGDSHTKKMVYQTHIPVLAAHE